MTQWGKPLSKCIYKGHCLALRLHHQVPTHSSLYTLFIVTLIRQPSFAPPANQPRARTSNAPCRPYTTPPPRAVLQLQTASSLAPVSEPLFAFEVPVVMPLSTESVSPRVRRRQSRLGVEWKLTVPSFAHLPLLAVIPPEPLNQRSLLTRHNPLARREHMHAHGTQNGIVDETAFTRATPVKTTGQLNTRPNPAALHTHGRAPLLSIIYTLLKVHGASR